MFWRTWNIFRNLHVQVVGNARHALKSEFGDKYDKYPGELL